MSKVNCKSEVIILFTDPLIAKHVDQPYFSADCKVRHKYKIFAMSQCKVFFLGKIFFRIRYQ